MGIPAGRSLGNFGCQPPERLGRAYARVCRFVGPGDGVTFPPKTTAGQNQSQVRLRSVLRGNDGDE